MGADRRGPLAAFVVIAIIAAILLVTSVRSQAAPRWLDPGRLPASVVASPVTEPHLWEAVTGGVHEAVREGAVLVHRATTDAEHQRSVTVAITTPTDLAVTPEAGDSRPPSGHQVVGPSSRRAITRPLDAAPAAHHARHGHQAEMLPPTDQPPTEDLMASILQAHDRGYHIGWEQGHQPALADALQGHGWSPNAR